MLRSQVTRRTQGEAGGGHARGVQEAGDAKVSQISGAIAPNEDVGRLHVTVDHSTLVHIGQGRCDPGPCLSRLGLPQWPQGQPLGQRLALDQLHDQVIAVVKVARVQQPHQVGVGKAGQGAHLGSKAGGIGGLGTPEHFYRHQALEADVLSLVHSPHTAPAQ